MVWEGIRLETGLRYFGKFTNPFSRINLANTAIDTGQLVCTLLD
jgi:hypothetical protein